jgi:hypothetical protein
MRFPFFLFCYSFNDPFKTVSHFSPFLIILAIIFEKRPGRVIACEKPTKQNKEKPKVDGGGGGRTEKICLFELS